MDQFKWSEECQIVYGLIISFRGANKGITQKRLSDLTGYSTRSVRMIVKELIEDHGVAIGSGNTGFYIPELPEEVRHIRNNLLARAYSILGRVSKLDKTDDFSKIMGQIKMKLEDSNGI